MTSENLRPSGVSILLAIQHVLQLEAFATPLIRFV